MGLHRRCLSPIYKKKLSFLWNGGRVSDHAGVYREDLGNEFLFQENPAGRSEQSLQERPEIVTLKKLSLKVVIA